MMIKPMIKNHEKLRCMATGMEIDDDGLVFHNRAIEEPSLLRTIYLNKKLNINHYPGLYQYSDWLPIRRILQGSSLPSTFRSTKLASYLGLAKLHITFNGYWKERNADMTTGTFKECEAYTVCSRFPWELGKTLVVASAGNTARAYMKVCSENQLPLVLVVPNKLLTRLWSTTRVNRCVKVVSADGDCDYSDAIKLSDLISTMDGFQNSGGTRNVAKRDGLGVTVLSAISMMGEIPDYYYQAIGSGAGAIAAYEANLRLVESGDYRYKMMKLHLSQNIPFTPIADAWKQRIRTVNIEEEHAKYQIGKISAKVLSNRNPPYGLAGGLYDALTKSEGNVFGVTNMEIKEACALFEKLEGCDILPESGAAVAALIKNINSGSVAKQSSILLNITGGGYKNIKRDFGINRIKPDVSIGRQQFATDLMYKKIQTLIEKE